jgi:dTDP-4-dehydrorhamnose reductase
VEETQTSSTSHKMTWLVLGAKGQLGQELIHLLKIKQIEATGTDRNEIDFAKPNEIAEKLTKLNPSHIVNCGAYTQVDKAEEEPELANLINAQAVGVIAKFASERKIPFVHISTDYVFDGTSTIAYLEDDKINPQSVYGSSKALGEKEALENNPESYILRTAWVYGEYGNNFPKVIAKKLRNHESLNVVNDQVGAPTWTLDLASAIIEILEKKPIPGIYHVTNSESCSWFEFAQAIAKTLNVDEKLVKPTDSKSFVRPAVRPKYSVLSNSKWENAGLTPLRTWNEAWDKAATTVLSN